MARPTRKKRNAVAGVPNICLLAAPVAVGQMSVESPVFRRPVRAVIAGENQKRVICDPCIVDGGHDSPQRIVHLGYEIAVDSGLGTSVELRRGKPRRVWRRQGEIKKKWLSRFCGTLANQIRALFRERGKHFFDLEARRNCSWPPEHAARLVSSLGLRCR